MNGRNELEYCRMLSSAVNDLDRRFGEFCFSQVRGQLKGAYLPEERIYCIEAAGEDGNRVEPLVRDIIDRGAWPSDDYQRLREIGFVHEIHGDGPMGRLRRGKGGLTRTARQLCYPHSGRRSEGL